MADEEKKDPFHPYVQELQGQEGDIETKIGILKEILKDVDVEDSWDERFDSAKMALDDLRKKIAERKIEDLEQELEALQGLARNPGQFNPPTPPPPWIWPWPWPPPPGFPGPGSATPGVINVGIVSSPEHESVKVGLTSRDFILARDVTTVWVWDPAGLKWTARLDTGAPIEAMEKVDGTVAVRTASALWLFHPLEYRWMGPLNAGIEQIEAFNLAYPTVVSAKED